MKNQSPLPDKGRSPQIFGPSLLWPNGWMDQDVTWYGGRPWPTRHCVRCGPSYPQKKGHSHSIFGPCLLWQMAGWMKPSLGTEVDIGAGHIVPSSHERGTAPRPLFSAHVYCGHGRPSQLLLSSCFITDKSVFTHTTQC